MAARLRLSSACFMPPIPGYTVKRVVLSCRITLGCAGLAWLTACASSSGPNVAAAPSTNFYISHAAGNYRPPGPPGDPWGPYITIAASRFDVPGQWIRQVMQVESGGQEYIDGQLTVSPAGAMGLMQLEPETYQEMAARYGLSTDPFNPYDNIMAGTAYIHEMYEVYGSPGFLAAYNAGPGRLDSFMNYNEPLPHETVHYVAMIAPQIQGYYPQHRSEADQLALNTEPSGVSTGILPAGYDPDAPQQPGQPMPEAPVQVAMLTPTPAPEAEPEPSIYDQSALATPAAPPPAYTPPAPAPVHTAPQPTFSLIPAAMADTPPPQQQFQPVEPGHVGWAVQVGAYNTASNANDAIGIAELSAVQMLMHGHPTIVTIHSEYGTKYRARVTGLPHDDAVDACQRLASGPTGCVVLSPEAQS